MCRSSVILDAGHVVAIHWGTFKLTLEPLAELPVRLREAGLGEDRFRALAMASDGTSGDPGIRGRA